jgi:hypothetical protein
MNHCPATRSGATFLKKSSDPISWYVAFERLFITKIQESNNLICRKTINILKIYLIYFNLIFF